MNSKTEDFKAKIQKEYSEGFATRRQAEIFKNFHIKNSVFQIQHFFPRQQLPDLQNIKSNNSKTPIL